MNINNYNWGEPEQAHIDGDVPPMSRGTPGSTSTGKSTARRLQRAVESPDHRALRLERQREYQRAYRCAYVENLIVLELCSS